MTNSKKKSAPLSMTRRYRRGLVIVGLLCMMVTLAIATVLFQRSYTVRVDKYLSQICDSVAAGYKAQPTHDAVTLANLLPESDTSLRFSLIDGGGTVLYDSEAAAGVVYDKDGKVYAVVAPDLPSHADRPSSSLLWPTAAPARPAKARPCRRRPTTTPAASSPRKAPKCCVWARTWPISGV